MSPVATVPRVGSAARELVLAAGGVLWRERDGVREVAVVRRRRHGGDCTLPKGKVRAGEAPLHAALREVREETGCDATAVEFAGAVSYDAGDQPKLVLFWTMVVSGPCELEVDAEVEEVVWLTPRDALEQLSYARERALLAQASRMQGTVVQRDDAGAVAARMSGLAKLRMRRPTFLLRRRDRRLEGAIVTAARELSWRAVETKQTAAPWVRAARRMLRDARQFLERGMIDEGWQVLRAAQRLEIFALDEQERAAHAAALRAEADAKLGAWRRTAVMNAVPEGVPSRGALRYAQYVVDEHTQNDYRRLALVADNLTSMGVVVGLLLTVLLFLSTLVPIPVGNDVVEPFELTVYLIAFGMLGGAVSAMIPRDADDAARKRVPEQLSSASFTKLRPVLGGASALLLYLFMNSPLFIFSVEITQGFMLLFAFAAGFSERLIVGAIASVVGAVNSDAREK